MCSKYCEYYLVGFMLIMSLKNILVNFKDLSEHFSKFYLLKQWIVLQYLSSLYSLTLLPSVCTLNRLPQETTGALAAVGPVVSAFAKCGKIPKCQTKKNLQKIVFVEFVSKKKSWFRPGMKLIGFIIKMTF